MNPFTLEAGRLQRPVGQARALSEQLVDLFLDAFKTIDDRFAWTSLNGRSNLVTSPGDRNLRVDFQKPCKDAVEPDVMWANFQLQGGPTSYACILIKMGPLYPVADLRAAWLASLRETRNARLNWRFVANKYEYAVLKSLDPRTPRTPEEIAQVMRRWGGWGFGAIGLEFQKQYQVGTRIPEALRELSAGKLAARDPRGGWTATADGTEYLRKQPIPLAF